MRSWMIAFSAGIFAAGFLPVLPAQLLQVAMLMTALLLHLLPGAARAGAMLLGVWWLCHTSAVLLARQWPVEDRLAEVWVTGVVTGLPRATSTGQRFAFQVQTRCAIEGTEPCAHATTLNPPPLVQLTAYEPFRPAPGQQWRLLVRLRPLHGFMNPGGYDYKLGQLQQGISATGYIRGNADNQLLAAGQGHWGSRLRLHMLSLLETVPGLQHGGLLAALTLGIRQDIPDSDWQLFTRTGINHLMVISGLHIGMVAGFLFLLGSRIARTSALLIRRWPASMHGALAALAGAAGYGALAGYSLPVQRALIMAGVLMSGVVMSRQTSNWNSYWLAMGLVLLIQPLAPQSAGFWLSFGAVALILARVHTGKPVTTNSGVLLATCVLQGRLWLGMLPVMLVWFQQASWLAPLVNLVAIPLVGMLVVPLALAGMALLGLVPDAGVGLLQAADFCLHILLYSLEHCLAFLPEGLLTLPALTVTGQALLLAATAAWLLCSRISHQALAAVMMGCALLLQRQGPVPGDLEVVVMDTGQGLAVLVSTANHNLLYDTGPRFSDSFDAGSDIVVPVLHSRNIRTLDRVIVSHADSDHAGGLAGVIDAYPGAHYLLPEGLMSPAGQAQHCMAGTAWEWDGVRFRVLHPDDGHYSRNNSSCVLEIATSEHVVLIPGDIEREVEYALLRRQVLQPVTLLIAPHHGSRTSSSFALLKTLVPRHVVFATGYLNRFRHPAAEIEQRYIQTGSMPWRTDRQGALEFRFTAGQPLPRVQAYREKIRRFWHQAPSQGFETGD